MKKTLIALAALASTAAFAQSSVTISGAMDAGYGRGTGAADVAAITTAGQVGRAAYSPKSAVTTVAAPRNNITFSGTEDLGGGLKTTFGAQYRFSPATGADTYGVPMEQVWLGMSGGFGSIKAGRFTGVFAAPQNAFDPWGTDSSGLAHAATARYNGQVAYYSPSFNGLTVSAQMNPQANNTGALQDGKEFAVSYAAGAVTANLATRDDTNKDKLTAINGSYNLGVATVLAGYTKTDVDNSTADLKQTTIAATMPVGAAVLSAGYRVKKTTGSSADEKRYAFRAQYNLSKRTAVVGDVYKDSKTGTTYQTGYYAGLRHTF